LWEDIGAGDLHGAIATPEDSEPMLIQPLQSVRQCLSRRLAGHPLLSSKRRLSGDWLLFSKRRLPGYWLLSGIRRRPGLRLLPA
jgi:hypothetical protein